MAEQPQRLQFSCRMMRIACLALYAGLTICFSPGTTAANDEATLEHRVKAAFLYKFASYVNWPERAFPRSDSPLTIAIIGAEAIAAELSQIVNGRAAQGRPVTVKRIRVGESLAGTHILFIGAIDAERLILVMQAAKSHPILVVTGSEGMLSQGSMINFLPIERRLGFEISLDNSRKSGLTLNSRLLAVAQRVLAGAP